MATIDDFIGVGFGFPMGVDSRGGIRMSRAGVDVDEAIRLILGTAPGERRLRPEFGCELHQFVFAPMNDSTFGLVSYYVIAALERWEPRIEVKDVRVHPAPDIEGCMMIEVDYVLRATLDPRTLVYPFYTIPGER